MYAATVLALLALGHVVPAEKGSFLGCYERERLQRQESISESVFQCVEDCEKSYFRYAALSDTKCNCLNVIRTRVLEDRECTLRCRQDLDVTCGGANAQSVYETGVEVAGPVGNLRSIGNATETTINISWDYPAGDGVSVDEYEIGATSVATYASYRLYPGRWTVHNSSSHFELSNLTPGTTYNVTVTSISANGRGGQSSILASTLIGVPDPEPEEPIILRRFDSTIHIQIHKAINNNGPINYYRVVVHYVNEDLVQQIDETQLDTFQKSKENGVPYYIAAELEMQNELLKFTVGDGREYRSYFNPPIPPRAHVHISIGIVSILNHTFKVRYATTTHEQHQYPDNQHVNSKTVEMEKNQTLIVILTVACVLFGIVLIASVLLYAYLRYKTPNNSRPFSDHHELTLQGPILEVENNGYMPDLYEQRGFDAELQDIISSLDLERKHGRKYLSIDINNLLGSGKYGDVLKGNLHKEGSDCPVQVHVITDDMDSVDQISFLNEFRRLTTLEDHPNVLYFYGVCVTPDWCYLLFEQMQTTLKHTLLNARIPANVTNVAKFSTISEEIIINILCLVCDGMQFLAENNIVNKKLCARTVYVNTKFEVKVSAFGPALYGDDTGQMIDIARWNAPEVIKFHNHSTKSDVWSFGLLVWECCTLGATPFGETTKENLFAAIRSGQKPDKPPFIFDDLYQLCLNCWDLDAGDRPEFDELRRYLRQTLPMLRYLLSFERTSGSMQLPPYLPQLELDA